MTGSGLGEFAGLHVSRETMERLERLVALLTKWNPAINLVSKKTIDDAWARHIIDSAQLFALAPSTAKTWVDLGSGAGFPGLVIACLAKELRPNMHVTLVEADRRKAAFLASTSHALGLDVTVIAERIESVAPIGADVVSARALAPLSQLCAFAQRHMGETGIGLFPKGASYAEEIAVARKEWNFDLTLHPSKTEDAAVILRLERLSHV